MKEDCGTILVEFVGFDDPWYLIFFLAVKTSSLKLELPSCLQICGNDGTW